MKKLNTLLCCIVLAYSLTAQIPSSGNVLWLKADNGVYTNTSLTAATNNQLVQVWADQSGNGNNFDQPVSGKRPLLVTNALCTNPVLRFTINRNTYMQSPFKLSGAKSIFLVFVLPSLSNSGETLLSIKGNGGVFTEVVGTDFIGYKPMSYVQDLVGTPSASGTLNVIPAQGNNAGFSTSGNLFSLVYDGTSNTSSSAYAARYDASSATVSSSGNFGRKLEDTTSIGARVPQQNINYFTGDIAEVIVYNRTLNNAEVLQVENYLSAKYGLFGSCTTLSISFTKMKVAVDDKTVFLNWEIANPSAVNEFFIEESKDGSLFKTVGIVDNNLSIREEKNFSFKKNTTTEGICYYRITARDITGNYFYSEVKKVTVESTIKSSLDISPNPASNFIMLHSSKNRPVRLLMYNPSGNPVREISTQTNKMIDIHYLNPGMYFIKTIEEDEMRTGKLIVK